MTGICMDYYRNSENRVLDNADYYLNGQTPCIFNSYNHAKIKNVFKNNNNTMARGLS